MRPQTDQRPGVPVPVSEALSGQGRESLVRPQKDQPPAGQEPVRVVQQPVRVEQQPVRVGGLPELPVRPQRGHRVAVVPGVKVGEPVESPRERVPELPPATALRPWEQKDRQQQEALRPEQAYEQQVLAEQPMAREPAEPQTGPSHQDDQRE